MVLDPKKWLYHWLHIPSGENGIGETEDELARFDFLELLNRWNKEWQHNPKAQYVYWE